MPYAEPQGEADRDQSQTFSPGQLGGAAGDDAVVRGSSREGLGRQVHRPSWGSSNSYFEEPHTFLPPHTPS
jgi:hypothetical protein